MKHWKPISMGCILALSMSPPDANALAAQAGLDACTDAMIEQLTIESGLPFKVHMDTESKVYGRLKRRDIIHLDARDSSTEEIVGRYDCIVSSRAKVIELKSLPLSAEDAANRAMSMD